MKMTDEEKDIRIKELESIIERRLNKNKDE